MGPVVVFLVGMFEYYRKIITITSINFTNEYLNRRGLIHILKMIPFNEDPQHTDKILELVASRPFMGRILFDASDARHLYDPYFRFGVVST